MFLLSCNPTSNERWEQENYVTTLMDMFMKCKQMTMYNFVYIFTFFNAHDCKKSALLLITKMHE